MEIIGFKFTPPATGVDVIEMVEFIKPTHPRPGTVELVLHLKDPRRGTDNTNKQTL